MDFPIKNGDFPLQTVSSPEGRSDSHSGWFDSRCKPQEKIHRFGATLGAQTLHMTIPLAVSGSWPLADHTSFHRGPCKGFSMRACNFWLLHFLDLRYLLHPLAQDWFCLCFWTFVMTTCGSDKTSELKRGPPSSFQCTSLASAEPGATQSHPRRNRIPQLPEGIWNENRPSQASLQYAWRSSFSSLAVSYFLTSGHKKNSSASAGSR